MLIINVVGILLIALIIWWFWLFQAKETQLVNNDTVIVVENGIYSPSRIKLPANKIVTLKFLRKDASPCAEMLLIPELQISKTLPLNKPYKIVLPALKAGDYHFHCQMQMYRGQIRVD
jgi:plastocyanin domain-containing protein